MAKPTKSLYDQLPPTNSLVGRAEEFVRVAAKRMVDNSNALTQEVVGKTGRPFGHMPLTDEEAYARYKMMRQQDNPDLWATELQGGKTTDITKNWRKYEERYRQETYTLTPEEVAQLNAMMLGNDNGS